MTRQARLQAMPLRAQIEVPANPPFHFVGTVFKPSHFPSLDMAFDETTYWQAMRFKGRVFGVRMRDAGRGGQSAVEVSIYCGERLPKAMLLEIAEEMSFRFDLKADLAEFEALCRRDRILNPVFARWGGMRVSAGQSLHEFLVIATVLQNATVRRSVQMLEVLLLKLGSKVLFQGHMLHAFWEPRTLNEVPEQQLRDWKLGYRAKTLKRQVASFADGALDEMQLRRLPSLELRERLLSLYGVGPASVGYLMFEVFKRYDALDYISPWEQKIFSKLIYGKDLVDVALLLADMQRRWGRWKMLAAHYLFEDLFWRHRTESIPWLAELIRL